MYHRASCIGILASGGHQDRVQMDTPLKGTSPNTDPNPNNPNPNPNQVEGCGDSCGWAWSGKDGLQFLPGGKLKTPWGEGVWGAPPEGQAGHAPNSGPGPKPKPNPNLNPNPNPNPKAESEPES